MKADYNSLEFKIKENYKREKKSPIRTLLKLTANSKSKKNISIEKRNLHPSTNLYYNNLSKATSARNVNVNLNYDNLNIKKNRKLNDNSENINYNSNHNLLLKKISNYNNKYNNYIRKNKNITVNCANNYKKPENKPKNQKQKKIKIEQNNDYFKQKMKKNIITYDNNKSIKNVYVNKNFESSKNKNDELITIDNNQNTNISFFNSKLEISNKKEKNKVIINNKKENERSNTNRNSSCINFYNKYLKNNYTKKTTNQKNANTKENDINEYKYKANNLVNEIIQPFSTVNNDEIYSNRLNIKKNFPKQNHNVIFNIKNENINTINNILINSKKDLQNIIYSPKKGIFRVHSQENVQAINTTNKIEDSNPINKIIYKNRSLKDLMSYTYSKKKYLDKPRNSNMLNKKYGIIDISEGSSIQNSDTKDENNVNKKLYNIKTIADENSDNYINEKKYQMEPDIYPEIKINLKRKKYKRMNKSVIIENRDKNNDINDNLENIIDKNNSKKYSSIFNKFKKNYELSSKKIDNNNKNFSCSSYISNINKSIGHSSPTNSYITISDSNLNNYLNNVDNISNKNLKSNLSNKILTVNDIYKLLVFEEKIKDIFNSILFNKIDFISYHCFELINYYNNYSINISVQNIIYDKIDLKNLIICNKYTLFTVIVFYELSFNKNCFKSVIILIKEIIKFIYSNLILVIRQSNNILKNYESQEKNKALELYDIINNILNKYINNKELYINDNEYMFINQNNSLTCEEKIYSNLNFIIRNIRAIVNNIKNIENFNYILNLQNMLNNVSTEDIYNFFKTKILRINIFNSSLLSSFVLENDYENKKRRIMPPYIININKKKFTLILSLDETIIHFKTNTFFNNRGVVQIRPGLIEFLQNIKKYYEIIIFSSGNKKYSDAIIDSIDEKNKYIDYRLYQEHCIIINDDFVKDLSKIGRPINKMVIIDNIPQNYRLHKENGINIKSFYGDNSNDRILFHLSKILINIAHIEGDIRKSLKKFSDEINFKISSNIFNNYCK